MTTKTFFMMLLAFGSVVVTSPLKNYDTGRISTGDPLARELRPFLEKRAAEGTEGTGSIMANNKVARAGQNEIIVSDTPVVDEADEEDWAESQ